VAVGFDFAPQPCGKVVKAALVDAGVEIDEVAYSQVLVVPPSVSTYSCQQLLLQCNVQCTSVLASLNDRLIAVARGVQPLCDCVAALLHDERGPGLARTLLM
jgi:hypothetical protein